MSYRKKIMVVLLLFVAMPCFCATDISSFGNSVETDSVSDVHNTHKGIRKLMDKVGSILSPDIDTACIEPQQYNLTAMGQYIRTYDHFLYHSSSNNIETKYSLAMSPESSNRIGPYFGWRWLFWGYTFSIDALNLNDKLDINASIYTPAIGIDVVYRNLGNDYRVRGMKIGDFDAGRILNGMTVEGLDINIMGLNVYYVVNPKHYSHQAAFNQTNRQIRSAGSWMFGTGYTRNSLTMDWDVFARKITSVVDDDNRFLFNDSTLLFNRIGYSSVPLTVGYGYNWVFAKNWLFALQLMGSLSYMHTFGDARENNTSFISEMFHDLSFSNFTLDGSLRVGIVWNNSRWFAGASAIYHTYNYRKENLSAYNIFGTINVYAGINFWKRKR